MPAGACYTSATVESDFGTCKPVKARLGPGFQETVLKLFVSSSLVSGRKQLLRSRCASARVRVAALKVASQGNGRSSSNTGFCDSVMVALFDLSSCQAANVLDSETPASREAAKRESSLSTTYWSESILSSR